MLAEVMSLDEKHDGGIEFLVTIHDFNEISRVLLCKDLNHDEWERASQRVCLPPRHT